MSIRQQRRRRKLVYEIGVLMKKRDVLVRDITILQAHLQTGKNEQQRRHIEEQK